MQLRKKTGNNQLLKEMNKARILELIRQNTALSRADIAELTGLSATAAGTITSCLLTDEYIYESGSGESKGGRRPVMLQLKPQVFYSVGVDIEIGLIRLVLMDVTGQIYCNKEIKTCKNASYIEISEKIVVCVKEILASREIQLNKVLGLGISVPGVIDVKTGRVVLAPNLEWEDAEIISVIKEQISIPVYIENEAMASAIYEHWLGVCMNIDNFVCINITSGIGAGIFTNGKPFKGNDGSAGEIGHIVVDENGPKCGCGNYGCLETLASIEYMEQTAIKMIKQGAATMLNNIEYLEELSINDIISAAQKGDDFSKNILLQSTRFIAIAVSNIVNNPSTIVLGKEFTKYSDLVMSHFIEIVMKKSLKYPTKRLQILSSTEGLQSSAIGAAIIPLKKLFGR